MKKAKTLEELADVELAGEGTYKFIVCEVKKGKGSKYVLVGMHLGYHADIYHTYSRSLSAPFAITGIPGGGRIKVTDKELYAYGHSGAYGKAPQEIVENLLKPYAEKNQLELKVEMGVGY